LRIAVTGASGLVGSRLVPRLRTLGHDVISLVRRAPRAAGEVRWEPERRDAELPLLEGTDVVIHLAGRNIADGRWTAGVKREIRDSRVVGTENLVTALLKLERRPSVFLGASAVGFYGHRPDEPCTEQHGAGTGFLSDVCRLWEAASAPLAVAGVRVANLRIGVVLAADGGAVPKMLTPFKLGAGGVIGSGRQPVPWIAADDLVEVIVRAVEDSRFRGPVNCVAPPASTNRDLTKALGRVLRRPSIAPLPAFVVKTLFGEMGRSLLLEGARVVPERLQSLGFAYRYPDLDSALRFELGRSGGAPETERERLQRARTRQLSLPPVRG
jgi:uncharacterized protein (TIGR01777 family)